jgi:hypothetical protein
MHLSVSSTMYSTSIQPNLESCGVPVLDLVRKTNKSYRERWKTTVRALLFDDHLEPLFFLASLFNSVTS